MRLSGQLFVIGSMVLLCSCVSGKNLRKRRQFDFVFPDEFSDFRNRGEFDGGFQNQFPGNFPNQFPQPSPPQQQRPQQQPLPQSSGGFFPPQPISPGLPANINSSPPEAAMSDMVLTTPSPSFLACMNSCPTTSEYNPICGTNRQLYFNQQKFDCALRCGAQVQVWRRGSCAGLFNMMRG